MNICFSFSSEQEVLMNINKVLISHILKWSINAGQFIGWFEELKYMNYGVIYTLGQQISGGFFQNQ